MSGSLAGRGPARTSSDITRIDVLARIGFFLMPFENLAIAPSIGWPAISPVFFMFSAVANIGSWRAWASFWLVAVAFGAVSILGWLSQWWFFEIGRNFVADVRESSMAFSLGLAFYFVLRRYTANGEEARLACIRQYMGAFVAGSVLALVFSLFILVFAHLFRSGLIVDLLTVLLKRNEDASRFAFLFAEPSFISVHVLGVVVPFAWLTWRLGMIAMHRWLLLICAAYISLGLLYSGSARLYLDVAYLATVTGVFWYTRSFVTLSAPKLAVSLGLIIAAAALAVSSPDVVEWLTLGRVSVGEGFRQAMYSDPSLASRFFRGDAALNGLFENGWLLLFGAGFGNIGALVDIGFMEAYYKFESPFTREVLSIYQNGNGDNVYNMYIRLVCEYGLVLPVVFIACIYRSAAAYLFFIISWCYLQFDSYAFYGIWVYLVFSQIAASDGEVEARLSP